MTCRKKMASNKGYSIVPRRLLVESAYDSAILAIILPVVLRRRLYVYLTGSPKRGFYPGKGKQSTTKKTITLAKIVKLLTNDG